MDREELVVGVGVDQPALGRHQVQPVDAMIASPPMKNISVTGTRYRMAIRLWSVVNSHEAMLYEALR